MKTYYFSIDFNQSGFEGKDKNEAMDKAEQAIKDGDFSINLVDEEEED